jgi:uncharacterized protein involved in cysteine biosynthesis
MSSRYQPMLLRLMGSSRWRGYAAAIVFLCILVPVLNLVVPPGPQLHV